MSDPDRMSRPNTRRVAARSAARATRAEEQAATRATSPDSLVAIDSVALLAAMPQGARDAPPLAPAQAVVGETRTIYTVLRMLDQGGMGAVYEARDGSLNRTVALKVMRRDQDPPTVARFIEEAQLTSQLEHPNIVPLHELGVDGDGRLFFAMKLIRGETLATRLVRWREQELTAALIYEAMTLVVKVCDALAYAHDRGVVHRDIKPANIMIGAYGEVVVMDWGVARILAVGARGTDRSRRAAPKTARTATGVSVDPTVMTQEGDVVGTPGYMPPEQARGDHAAIAPAADVYAVGAVIYEILTGTPPVRGRTLTEVISRTIAASIRRPSAARSDRAIPAELEAVAMKALAAEPRARYANARLLSTDLQAYLAGRSVSALKDGFWPALRRLVRRNRALTATLGVSALTVLLIAAFSFKRVLAERDLARTAGDDAVIALRHEKLANDTAKAALQLASASEAARGASERAEAETLRHDAERAAIRVKAFAPYAQGLDLLQRGGFADEAARLLKQAVAIDPDFAEAAFAYGHALRQQGDPAAAARAFLAADAISRRLSGASSAPALLEAAFANDDAQSYHLSLAEFADLAKSAPDTCIGEVARCFIAGADEDFATALASGRRALQLEPRMWEAHLALGYALTIADRVGLVSPEGSEDAVRELRTAIAMAPRRGEPLQWLVLALAETPGDHKAEILADLDKAIAVEPRNASRYLARADGIIGLRGPDDPQVREDIDRASALGVSVGQRARIQRERALARDDPGSALAAAGQIPDSDVLPQDVERSLGIRLHIALDAQLMAQIEAFLHAHPGSPSAAMLLVAADCGCARWSDALAQADATLRIAPYLMAMKLARAVALTHVGRGDLALEQADEVLRARPECYQAMEAKVVALILLKRGEEAHLLYISLIKANPPSAKPLVHIKDLMRW